MGLSLCAEKSREDILTEQFPEFDTSGEELDIDESDEESVYFQSMVHARVGIKTFSAPNIKLDSTQTHQRSSAEGFASPVTRSISLPSRPGLSHQNNRYVRRPSLKERLRERNSRPYIERFAGEDLAKQWTDTLESNTLTHLNHTFDIAESIVHKGEDIREELARQDVVIRKANRGTQTVEVDMNEAGDKLNGMKSLRGKVASLRWRKKPKVNGLRCEDGKHIVKLPRSKSVATTASYRKSRNETSQQQIKMGVKQLCSTMDMVMNQQLDIAETLQHQEGYINEIDSTMDRVQGKMHYQTDLMSCIRVA